MADLIKFKLEFYEIVSCGYYEHGKDGVPSFCGTSQMCDHFLEFYDEKKSILDKVHVYSSGSQASSFPVRVKRGGMGSCLFVFWNPTTDSERNVLYVDVTSRRNNEPKITKKRASRKQTPGFPTYFWIPPSMDFVVVVSRPGWRKKKSAFDHYIKNFLMKLNKHHCFPTGAREVLLVEEEDGVEIEAHTRNLIYARERSFEEPKKIYPKFKLKKAKKSPELDKIRRRYLDINKVILKSKVKTRLDDVKTALEMVFDFIVSERSLGDEERQVDFFTSEINYYPSMEGFDELVELASNLQRGERLGVKMRGASDDESSIKWFDEVIESKSYTLSVDIHRAGYPKAQSLIDALESNMFISTHIRKMSEARAERDEQEGESDEEE